MKELKNHKIKDLKNQSIKELKNQGITGLSQRIIESNQRIHKYRRVRKRIKESVKKAENHRIEEKIKKSKELNNQ